MRALRPHDDRTRTGHGPRLWLAMLALAVCASAAQSAQAEGEKVENARFGGWSAAFEIGPHVIVQRARGSLDTNFDYSRRKANNLSSLNMRLGAEILAPELGSPSVRFRPVVYGGLLLPLNESSTVGAELIQSTLQTFQLTEEAKFSVEYQVSGLVGLGVEFRVPVLDSEITIRPAIESLHLSTRYAGLGGTVEDPFAPNLPTIEHEVRGQKEIMQHFVGPSLRVGSPDFHFRGVILDFHLGASLVFDVAGTRKKFRVVEPSGDRADFNFETGTGAAQVGLGLRIRVP